MKFFIPSFIFLLSISGSYCEDDAFKEMDKAWSGYEKSVTAEYDNYEKEEQAAWNKMKERIKAKWTDAAMPGIKKDVVYSAEDESRTQLDYENGKIELDMLVSDSKNTKEELQDKIFAALQKSFSSSDEASLVNWKEIVKDAAKLTVKTSKWGIQQLKTLSRALADKVEKQKTIVAGDKKPRELFTLSVSMVPDYVKKRAANFLPTVKHWAGKYNLDPAFVLGLMRQESAFNPKARSYIPAFGLMQIVPKFAGEEVLTAVTGKKMRPDSDFLYDPAKNIMVGTTYLQLLRDKYFPHIKDSLKQQFLITCSYNWGPGRILNAIKKGKISPKMSHEELYTKLREIAPEETSIYLKKVTQYANDFRGL